MELHNYVSNAYVDPVKHTVVTLILTSNFQLIRRMYVCAMHSVTRIVEVPASLKFELERFYCISTYFLSIFDVAVHLCFCFKSLACFRREFIRKENETVWIKNALLAHSMV